MGGRIRVVVVLFCALAAALATYRYLASLREVETVVIAATAIPAGSAIEAPMLRTVTVGKREREVLVPGAVQAMEQVLGRAPKRDLAQGTVLTLNPDDFFLSEEAARQAGLGAVPPAYFIPAGYVAIAVPVEADTSVGFALQKADRVNVIFTGKRGDEVVTRTVLTNVAVFDVGRPDTSGLAGGDRGALRTVTLLVTPEEAEKVALAKHSGKVDLALTGR